MSTDWITEGAKVAVLSCRGASETVSLTTVERFTATQIVLNNGHRYRRDDLRRVGGGDSWTSHAILRPEDPRALHALANGVIRTFRYRIDELAKGKAGVDGLTAYLDAVEAECAKARTKLAAWAG